MKVVKTIADCRKERAFLGNVALVPTMGALHEGHVSLMRIAREHAQHVIVSIFVNPTQFSPQEDFSKYPRPIEADLEKCAAAGVDMVFNPPAEEMYPPGSVDVVVDLPALSTLLEGKHRQGHFKGVCQVVCKLFNVTTPQVACFGQKDYQQLRIITAMVEALDLPITIVPCSTVREPDGLAMSSRNQYLAMDERKKALTISRALFAARDEFKGGVRQTNRLITTMQKIILEQHVSIDYVAAVNPATLKHVDMVEGPTLLAIAVRVGKTRLIDNLVVG